MLGPEDMRPELNSESAWEAGGRREWRCLSIINKLCKSKEEIDIHLI